MSNRSASESKSDYQVIGPIEPGFEAILTPEALELIAGLTRRFRPAIEQALLDRAKQQEELDKGNFPDFRSSTKKIRESDWKIAGTPSDLQDRKVEITGPTDRKMVINALNSGARVFMADCEDSLTPTWHNVIDGQINLRDAVNRTIEFTNPNGKEYRLNDEIAVLIVRPRGWHLVEKHILVDGEPAPGGLVDFALYLVHNARKTLANGSGPYYYLPKLECHEEARIWADVFECAEQALDLPHGTIKCTVLIENVLTYRQLIQPHSRENLLKQCSA